MTRTNDPLDDALGIVIEQAGQRQELLREASEKLSEQVLVRSQSDPTFPNRLTAGSDRAIQELADRLGQEVNLDPELVRPLADALVKGAKVIWVPLRDEARVRESVLITINDIRRAFNLGLVLNTILFVMGFLFASVAAVIGFQNGNREVALFMLTGGFLGMFVSTLSRPVRQIDTSTSNLLKHKTVVSTHQLLTELGDRPDLVKSIEDLERVANMITSNTNSLMSNLVESRSVPRVRLQPKDSDEMKG